jgi:glycerol-3-phosphate acyltransferase PlsY
METILMVLFAYLLGSIPTGYLLGCFSGVDIREAGSRNVGATNVARVVGKKQGLVTLVVDVAKGFLPVFLSLQLGFDLITIAAAALAAVVGHLYPIFLRFRGGKGVATGLGIYLAIAPGVSMLLLVFFALVVSIGRRISVASIAAAGAGPVILWLSSYPPPVVGLGFAVASMVIFRHQENIRRLLSGTEPKFQF